MKMRNLLFGVILGLLAAAHSTPVDNVTQIPTKPDDDVLREVMEDGYLVEEMTPRLLTTNPPRKHTTVQASQQPASDSEHTDIEGSAETTAEPSTAPVPREHDTHVTNMTQSENATSTQEAGDSRSVLTTTQSSHPKFLSVSVPPKAPSTPSLTNQTYDIEDSSGDLTGNGSYGSGSGDIQNFVTIASKTTTSDTKESTESASFPVGEDLDGESEPGTESEKEADKPSDKPSVTESDEPSVTESDKPADKESDKESGTESDKPSVTESDKPADKESDKESGTESSTKSGSVKTRIVGGSMTEMATQQQGHDKVMLNDQTPTTNAQHSRTPGWIIIVAFIVGLAALVMLCVAIATRDKWNGPHKSSQLEPKTDSSDQQREQEMTTFVSKESPRENGKAAEYTVIPLDELPENYSSH